MRESPEVPLRPGCFAAGSKGRRRPCRRRRRSRRQSPPTSMSVRDASSVGHDSAGTDATPSVAHLGPVPVVWLRQRRWWQRCGPRECSGSRARRHPPPTLSPDVTSGGGSAEPSPGAPGACCAGADAPSGRAGTQGPPRAGGASSRRATPTLRRANGTTEALGHDGEQVSRLDPVTLGDAAHGEDGERGQVRTAFPAVMASSCAVATIGVLHQAEGILELGHALTKRSAGHVEVGRELRGSSGGVCTGCAGGGSPRPPL